MPGIRLGYDTYSVSLQITYSCVIAVHYSIISHSRNATHMVFLMSRVLNVIKGVCLYTEVYSIQINTILLLCTKTDIQLMYVCHSSKLRYMLVIRCSSSTNF